jgi:hypothetical protein
MSDEWDDARPIVIDPKLLRTLVVRLSAGEALLLLPADFDAADARRALKRAVDALTMVEITQEAPSDDPS